MSLLISFVRMDLSSLCTPFRGVGLTPRAHQLHNLEARSNTIVPGIRSRNLNQGSQQPNCHLDILNPLFLILGLTLNAQRTLISNIL